MRLTTHSWHAKGASTGEERKAMLKGPPSAHGGGHLLDQIVAQVRARSRDAASRPPGHKLRM